MRTTLQNKIIDLFQINSRRRSPKGWYEADCPFCKKEEHLGVNLGELSEGKYKDRISFRCVKCGEKGGLIKLLKQIGKEDLLEGYVSVDATKLLEKKIGVVEEKEDLSVPNKKPPIGWKRMLDNEYLNERGFEPWQYELYPVGMTKLFPRLKGYIVFLVEEEGNNKGYIARSTKTKEEIKRINDKIKEYNKTADKDYRKMKYLRYQNEGGVDFDKLLFGLDEITEETHTAIIVEGITDKSNVDRKLQLNISPEMKCCVSFGKALSPRQITKLKEKGISSVILLYDPDAINDSKEYGAKLESEFNSTKIGFLKDKDPGDLSLDEILNVFENLEAPINFFTRKVQKKIKKI